MKSSNGKTVFREVTIEGKSVRYLSGFHNFKAETVNKASVAIVESEKALDCPGVPGAVNPYDF